MWDRVLIFYGVIAVAYVAVGIWVFFGRDIRAFFRDRVVPEFRQLGRLTKRYEKGDTAILLERGLCPDCRGHEFMAGPEGPGAINMKCANEACGSKWCFGPPIIAKRIDNADAFYNPNHIITYKA